MKNLVKKSAVAVLGAVVLVTALESYSFFQLDNSSSLFLENVDSEAYWTQELYSVDGKKNLCTRKAPCTYHNQYPLSPEDEWLPGEKYVCDRADNFGSDHCTISECVRKL